jgi:UDP-N-acetylmuramoylalanine--D-glutamate ligase
MKSKYKNKRVAVLGLGIEGKDAINYLLKEGADVTLFDRKPEAGLDFAGIPRNKIDVIVGSDYLKDGLVGFDFIVRSPGVYRFIPEIVDAEKQGVVVTSAIKMFFDECPAQIIGVTGTKGKGTTSTLIYEILKAAGKVVYLAGNIGKPYLELLREVKKNSWVILEMSSFQLIDMTSSPHIAVVLNVTEDHLDWHKSREEYINAKKNIVRYQTFEDFAVINEEYKVSKSFASETRAKVVFFSKKSLDNKFKQDLLLRGEHNLENIAAAVSVARILEIDDKEILEVVKKFKGLEHRLELVDTIGGVTFYNDSFATGPQPTIAAINSFSEPETLILGGSDKGLDYKELGEVIKNKPNVKNIILIGDTRSKIFDTFKGSPFKGKIFDLGYSSMKEIVTKAFEVSPKGGVVVLSPAAASFDMFENYKDRGNQFKKAVESLRNEQK